MSSLWLQGRAGGLEIMVREEDFSMSWQGQESAQLVPPHAFPPQTARKQLLH